ncbi:iron-siderophore ABC transporter substrate-binding protein [Corynebacterium sp. AOP12-C2-36]|uniref:iron-siderophore ABC transporter substrate-binding protein n=1 Tax=Corynebacterium sp. AOP12-C2-36 TaxID=3457723 RepID=UPI0040340773
MTRTLRVPLSQLSSLRTLLIALVAVLGLVLTACSSDGGDDSDGNGGGSSDTITVEHAFGTTEIDGTPERVATVQFENQEVPLALGVVPVGMAKANFGGSDVLPWVQEKLDELGATGDEAPVLFDETDGIDFEAVSDTAPDVILAGYSGITEEDYEKLSEIAPTVPFPADQVAWGTTWRENIEIESKAIGKEDEGQDLIADLEEQIAAAADERPEIKGKKTMFLTHVDPTDLSQVSFYTTHDARPKFFEDLGMEAPDSIREFSEDNPDFSGTISAEQADVFDDVEIIVTYGDQEMLDTMKDDPILGQIPAIQNDAVVLLGHDELGTAAMPTPLGVPYILDDYVAALADAAAKGED